MNILCVCGMGIGTSILLKMNVENVADELGIDADVETADIGTAKGAAQSADLILTSEELAEELGNMPNRIVVNNFMDTKEIRDRLTEAIA